MITTQCGGKEVETGPGMMEQGSDKGQLTPDGQWQGPPCFPPAHSRSMFKSSSSPRYSRLLQTSSVSIQFLFSSKCSNYDTFQAYIKILRMISWKLRGGFVWRLGAQALELSACDQSQLCLPPTGDGSSELFSDTATVTATSSDCCEVKWIHPCNALEQSPANSQINELAFMVSSRHNSRCRFCHQVACIWIPACSVIWWWCDLEWVFHFLCFSSLIWKNIDSSQATS